MNLLMPLAAMLMLAAPAQDPAADAKLAAVAGVIGDDVAVVVHVDLVNWKPEPFLRRVLGPMTDGDDEVASATKLVGDWVDGLKRAGAKDLYILVDLVDMPGTPVAVVPLTTGADPAAISKMLLAGAGLAFPASETIRGVLVAATPSALNRVRDVGPKAKPEILAALAAGKAAPLQIVVAPGTTLRRSIEESMPALPPQLGGGPISGLTKGLRWASLAMEFEPRSVIHARIQAADAEAAKDLEKLALVGLGFVAKSFQGDKAMAPLSGAISEFKPRVAGDFVTMEVDLEKAAVLVAVPLNQAREAGHRSGCVNNLKQIGLAMHNFHSANDALPPAFRASKEGKPLLSWRVMILPYLEQKALYDQFHLDEPWDSPHNKALISQMPTTYACPSGSKKLAAEGKTSYLTPRGAGTLFPGAEAVKFQDVTDGLSNTIMVAEAGDAQAVTWTRPDDWEVPPASKVEAIFGHHPGGTNALFGDGAVRFIKGTIAAKVLDALLTRKGGEVINADEF